MIDKVKSSSVQIHPLVKNALTRMVGDMSSMTYVELVQHWPAPQKLYQVLS